MHVPLGWNSWLTASVCPSPNHYGHFQSEAVDTGDIALSLSFFFSLSLPHLSRILASIEIMLKKREKENAQTGIQWKLITWNERCRFGPVLCWLTPWWLCLGPSKSDHDLGKAAEDGLLCFLLALAGACHCGHLGSERGDGRGLSLCLSLPLC